MTRPTSRVLALLAILQAGGTRTAAELAAAIGVDERTVRRYVAHLVELDVPVRSERGRHGGFRLARGYRMPPLMLTDEEAVAVLVGMVAADRAGLVPSSAAAAHSAAAKIRRVLPRRLGAGLDTLVEGAGPPGAGRPREVPATDVLLLVAEAAREQRAVAIDYRSGDGHAGERTLHPYAVVAHAGRWYVTGADSASGEDRTFRVDRVRAARLLEDTFPVPDTREPNARLLTALATAPRRHTVRVLVRSDRAHVVRRVPPGLATVEAAADDGWLRLRLEVEELDWVPSLLAWIDRPFVVEEPDALRGHVRALADRLRRAADDVEPRSPAGVATGDPPAGPPGRPRRTT
ncbi:helix-turn-helix transcriptional regulator [Pseudonocardia benzenivorans]|uniref:Helix-turn-helix type 11 domain-containing protein n=2 Tax=Pseudonocardia TaxID=1847 RepID=F4CR46_PSEUX|nr:YafY family protein [Pseudonocardia dioxanivorans]AEA24483.1 helix-turn-helix type 11 domain-containing protein [Pseudonocardia dioxanivorans CB1190]